jgi:[ribosomal protein S5]-alanine N-acetyltransferase
MCGGACGYGRAISELKLLHADNAQAVPAFELANRVYFAAYVSGRGDSFFDQFAAQFEVLLAEQEAGNRAFHVSAT